MNRVGFEFLGLPCCLETGWGELEAVWRHLYGHFLSPQAAEGECLTWRVSRSGEVCRYTPPGAGHTWSLWPRTDVVADTIFHDALTRIPDYLMVHAGALEGERGDGVMVVGESHHGKSTLTLALMLAGFRFLSDEVAAVRLADGRLQPFPRLLSVRDGTIGLLGLEAERAASGYRGAPWMVEPESLRAGALSAGAPVRHLFFLHDPDRAEPERRTSRILMTGVSADWPVQVRQVAGVTLLQFGREGELGSADLLIDDSLAFARFEQFQRRHQVLTLSITAARLHQPAFRGPVQVRPLTAPEAALRLWPHLHNGLHSPVLAGAAQGDPRPLLRTTMQLLSGVACHELHVGPLQEMVAAVRQTVGERGERQRARSGNKKAPIR